VAREDCEAIIRKYLRAWNTADLALFEEVLAPDFVDYMYGELRTRDALLKQAASQDASTTDRNTTIEDVLCDGDKIAVRVTSRLTHRETGQPMIVTGMVIARIENGKVVEGWGEHDRLGQLQQLGLIPGGEALRPWIRERLGLEQ
jgi:ketosteroid isomerase-like protein